MSNGIWWSIVAVEFLISVQGECSTKDSGIENKGLARRTGKTDVNLGSTMAEAYKIP